MTNYRGESVQRAASKPRQLPRQSPYKRRYPSGGFAWVARYFDQEGKAHYAKPSWNGRKSSFSRLGDAQRAIDDALRELHGAPPDALVWWD